MYKKSWCFAVLFSILNLVSAQGNTEAFRYFNQGIGGSTKSLGSANAFGAVGGDVISASINPGGMGMIRKSQLNFGLNIHSNTAQAQYITNAMQGDGNTGIGLGHAGLIVSILKRDDKNRLITEGLNNLTFYFNYNRHSDYRTGITFEGNNTKSSFTDYLAEQANGQLYTNMNINSLGYLGFQSYLIEPKLLQGYDDSFASLITSFNTNVRQKVIINRSGSAGDYNLGAAGNFNNKFYFGMGLIIKSGKMKESFTFEERDFADTIYSGMTYNQYLETAASGAGLNLGGILKLTESFRIGLSYASAVRLAVTDRYTRSIVANFDRPVGNPPRRVITATTPDYNFDNIQDTLVYKYKFGTPSRTNISLAYIIKKSGFISFDAEYFKPTGSKFFPVSDNYIFSDENNALRTELKAVWNLRFGGEFVLGKYRLRAGYAYYPSYQKSLAPAELNNFNRQFYTLGFGYNEKNYTFSAAMVINRMNEVFIPYQLRMSNNFHQSRIKNSGFSLQFGATLNIN